eukprot:CAMPEP_0118971564 /NCGR_PEP_ID=MMETSP1173-20130426/8145_1 /TAXON_ID=1034831 /ORGANISM="Rhizochromulina marina cf, Strain CCMP1243" /LENGTH=670 /DNA_ID=CAMNT_0006921025 /DNA_START=121 /DNA_END=2133 /DNA_ORIENTATION=-
MSSSPWSDVGAPALARSLFTAPGDEGEFPSLGTTTMASATIVADKHHVEPTWRPRSDSLSSRGSGYASRPQTPPAARPAAPTSAVAPVENADIPGLFTWSVGGDATLLRSLRTSVLAMFDQRKGQPKHGRRRMSDVIELGILFASAEKLNKFDFADDTEKCEAHLPILRFIAAQLAQHRDAVAAAGGCHPVPFNDHNINVVVRRYRPGQSIGFHTDRVEKLDDMVWSVVVDCGDPDDGLHFELPDGRKVPVPEFPGLVSVQTGLARHTFKHGVSSVKHERISITWRHFLPAYLEQLEPKPVLTAPDRMEWLLGEIQRARTTLPPSAPVVKATVTSSPTHVADPIPVTVVPPLIPALVLDPALKHAAPWLAEQEAAPGLDAPPAPRLLSPRGTMSEALGSAYQDVSRATPRAKIGVITSPMGGAAGAVQADEQRRLVIRHLCASVGEFLGERFPGEVSVLCCDDQKDNENLGALAAGLHLSNPDAPFRYLPERGRPALEADQVRFTDGADVYLLIEGGFDSALLARQVEEAGKPLIRLACSGGAAADWFGILQSPAAGLPGAVDQADAKVLASLTLATRDWRQRVLQVADATSKALNATMQAQVGGEAPLFPPRALVMSPRHQAPLLSPWGSSSSSSSSSSSLLSGLDAGLKGLTLDRAPGGSLHHAPSGN